MRAFISLKKLRTPESFYSWLLGIAGRVAKEQFRSALHRRQDCEFLGTTMTDVADEIGDYPIEEAIAVLPEIHRQVIVLRFYEGLSCQEVASRLKVLGAILERVKSPASMHSR